VKTYRIIYWIGSIITDAYVKAQNAEEAEAKFREHHKSAQIVRIEED
jgi:hypothetical protein